VSNLKEALIEEYNKVLGAMIDPNALMEMINETLDSVYEKVVLPEAEIKTSKAKEFLLVLPKFVPTEAWGDPNSMERAQITRLFNVIGGGRDIAGKLSFLQRITSPDNRITSPRRIISSLIILESLSAVVTSFNAASAGFVFEGFLAALLQGRQEAEISAKGNLPIQDLIAFVETESPVPISLKLLNLKTNIEGSYTNLIDGLDEFGKMVYIVARKDGEAIAIEQFTFDQENFIDALSTSARGGATKGEDLFQVDGLSAEDSIRLLKGEKVSFKGEDVQLRDTSWAARYELLQNTRGYSNRVRDKRKRQLSQSPEESLQDPDVTLEEVIREEWNILTETKGGTQWSISPPQLKSFDFVDYQTLGELPYSADNIEKVAELHMDKLNGALTELFTATKLLSENINKYFTFDKRARAINSGEKAIENSKQIQSSLQTQISTDEENE